MFENEMFIKMLSIKTYTQQKFSDMDFGYGYIFNKLWVHRYFINYIYWLLFLSVNIKKLYKILFIYK